MSQKEEIKMLDTKLEVPYSSQYLDVTDKEQALKACGMTCVFMVINFFGINNHSLDQMVSEGISNGGFSKNGWIHDYFVKLFNRNGLKSNRMENMRDSDVNLIAERVRESCPVIVSVERRMFNDRRFHMIVITGIRENEKGELEGFFYHDPAYFERGEAQHRYVDVKTFFLSWRRMAIFAKQ